MATLIFDLCMSAPLLITPMVNNVHSNPPSKRERARNDLTGKKKIVGSKIVKNYKVYKGRTVQNI